MTPGAPDRDPLPPPAPSLAGLMAARLAQVARRRTTAPSIPRPSWRSAALLALLIAAGPLITWLAATLLASRNEGAAAQLAARVAPVQAAQATRDDARRLLAVTLARPGPAQLLDQLAAVLPPDAHLARAERLANGALEIEVATSDPDALRAALRRSPALAGLRDVRQQEGEGRTLVLLRRGGA